MLNRGIMFIALILYTNKKPQISVIGSHFCREHHWKGGVASFVKEDLEASTQGATTGSNEELTLEMGMVQIAAGKIELYILGVSRTPSGQLVETLNVLSTAV